MKVLWAKHTTTEATQEAQKEMLSKYFACLLDQVSTSFADKTSLKKGHDRGKI